MKNLNPEEIIAESRTEDYAETELNTISADLNSNVVGKKKLRTLQRKVLNDIAGVLRQTYGPMGSNTWIITGNNKEAISSKFTKDGRSVLKKIIYTDPIAMAIEDQIEQIAMYTDKEVGDGTTSATLLSDALFNAFSIVEKEFTCSPQKVIDIFHEIVDKIKDTILENKTECDLDDIYNISLTSTNGNETIANRLKELYKSFGNDVYIDIKTSNDTDSKIKVLDGLTLDEGYSDPSYINTANGTATLYNPRIYYFEDNVDTPEMIGFMEKIIDHNIMAPARNREEVIPTVIVAPTITKDASPMIRKMIEFLTSYDKQDMKEEKPPLLIVANILLHSEKMNDIATLCGTKPIQKYIDPKIQAEDIKKGDAPTIENVHEFYGSAAQVVADINTTKFINPKEMFVYDENGMIETEEDGTLIHSPIYNSLHNWLDAELKNAIAMNEDSNTIGKIRKRLNSLDSNMVEYYVGGISTADIEAEKALLQDAVRNCRSASKYGYGRGANMEGLCASYHILQEEYKKENADNNYLLMASIILTAYKDIVLDLYSPIYGEDKAKEIIEESIKSGNVYDIRNDKYSDKVITSIYADHDILTAVSKIITLLMTTNQALIQHPSLNVY